MKNNFKKTISLVMTVLMLMTCWVFVAPTQADAIVSSVRGNPAINGSKYAGTTAAYGTPVFDGDLDRWFKFLNGNDYTIIYYPSHIYLDKSETLQSAGYYFNIDWHFGNSTDYRILLGANIWGDHSQWSGKPTRYYTMNNIFSNYAVDASLPSGSSTNYIYGVNNPDSTSFDVRVVGYNYSNQGTDGFSDNNIRHEKYVLFRSNTSNDPNTATIYLKGTPSASYVGTTNEYNTSGDSFGSYGLCQKWGSSKWGAHENGTAQFRKKGDSSSYMEGQWIEMAWNVTIYDKEALNSAVTKSNSLYNSTNGYTSYLTSGNYSTFTSNRSSASTLLKTRKTNQTEIGNQTTALTNAAEALVFAADNTALKTAITKAQAIKNESNYATKYTAATRQALETALNNATSNTTFDTYVPTYSISFSDNSTWNAGEKAAADQNSINALTNALNAVTMEVQKYNITFNFANGNVTTNAYNYGTIITVPENSTKAPDATNHYSYKWPANVSTEVLGNATYNEIETATAHDWNDWVITANPGCLTEGSKERSCKVCGYIATEVIAQNGHTPKDAVEENRNDASCTDDGLYESVVYCDVCGDVVSRTTVVLPSSGHNEVIDEAVPVTCTTDGKTQGKHCDTCGEVLVEQQTIPHQGHKEETIPAVGATCTTSGKTEGVRCSACKTVLVEPTTVPSPGHTWSETYISNGHGVDATHYRKCTVCTAETANEAHTWNEGEVTKAPTCEADGQRLYTCTANGCGGQYIGKELSPGHNYGEWIEEDSATCLEGGTAAHYECSACHKYFDADKNEIGDITIGALNHDPVSHEGQAATCYVDGWEAYETCLRCTYTTYKAIPATNHEGTLVQVDAQAPTCDEIGWAAYEYCTACDYTTYEEIPATNHEGTLVQVDAQAPTCDEIGWDAYEYCTACDYTTYEEIEALNHKDTLVYVDAKAATCYDFGWAAYEYCTVCDYTTYDVIPATNHKGTLVKVAAQAPTCDEIGWDAYEYCTACDYTTYAEKEALNHKDTLVQVDAKAPTCTVDGNEAYEYCTACDYTTYKKIDALNHKDTLVQVDAKAATCYDFGWAAYEYCTACDYTTYDVIPATNHEGTLVQVDAQAPTCEDIGWAAYEYCTACTYTTYAEEGATGHNPVKVGEKAPTCDAIGWNAYEYCLACDYTTYNELPATNHEGTLVKVAAQAPTCVGIGWDEYEYCTACDYTTYNELTGGGHTLEAVEAKKATCTEDGWYAYEACTECDYDTKVIEEATGHTYVDHEGKAPNCVNDGWEAYQTCENCDYTTYKTIGAFGHAIAKIAAQAPTCENAGWYAYEKCLRCDYTTYEEIGALGHDIAQYEAKDAGCEEDGWYAYEACSRGDYTTKVVIPATGHSMITVEAKETSCGAAGWYEHEACENCDYSTKVEIPALKHEIVKHEAQAATCAGEGWEAYETCENCDYTTYKAIPALEHNPVQYEGKAPTCNSIGWEAYEECTNCEYTTYTELPVVPHKDADKDGVCDNCEAEIGCLHETLATVVVNATCMTYGKVTILCEDCGNYISEEWIAPSGHHDHNNDGECDDCSAPTTVSDECGCACHKDSMIARIIYSISRFFWKLLKINKSCTCGAVHY